MTLLDLVREDVGELTQRGCEFWSCCPFHGEKTPSFSVNEEKGMYFCFGCGAKGDAITYARAKRGLSFRDAAALVGKELPETDRERQARERAVKERLLSEYFLWYHRKLAESCDLFRELNAEREVAEVAFQQSVRRPDLYTDEEHEHLTQFLADLYDALPVVEQDCDVLTYDCYLKERFGWWEEERRG